MRKLRPILMGLLGVAGFALISQGVYIQAKAQLAQVLMERAWTKTALTGVPHLPWDWMDAYPIARLKVPEQDISAVILNQDSGQALAFGPGIISGTSSLNDLGMTGIAAHKNTHFRFLKDMKIGEFLVIDRPKGITDHYRVYDSEIIDTRLRGLSVSTNAQDPKTLALVTCYPFDSISFNGPLRYVVYARKALET